MVFWGEEFQGLMRLALSQKSETEAGMRSVPPAVAGGYLPLPVADCELPSLRSPIGNWKLTIGNN